jgi:hypothetical protein
MATASEGKRRWTRAASTVTSRNPGIAVYSLQHERIAKREQAGIAERRLGRSGMAARDPQR